MTYYRFVIILFTIHLSLVSKSQVFCEIRGLVKNSIDKEPVSRASIFSRSLSVGTFANDSGQFILFLPSESLPDSLIISSIGYRDTVLVVSSGLVKDDSELVIPLQPSTILLSEVVVKDNSRFKMMVEVALKKLNQNLPKKQHLLGGFYRELAMKDSSYVRLIEAAVEIHDFGFGSDIEKRRVKVIELRKSEDYITYGFGSKLYKLLFGDQNMLVQLSNGDFIRNYSNSKTLSSVDTQDFTNEYQFTLDRYVIDGEDSIRVIKFFSDEANRNRPYYEGRVFINMADHAILKMEYGLLANPTYTFKTQRNVFYQGKFLFKKEIEYKKFDGKYYPIRYLLIKPVNFDSNSGEAGQQYASYELMINSVIAKKKDFDRVAKRNAQQQGMDLYSQDFKYNENFWEHFNMIEQNPLKKKIVSDLEIKKKLDEQFKHK